MLLLALTSIYWSHEDSPDNRLFGDWIVWDGFKLLKPSQPPSEPKGYDLKVGSLIAIGDTWYNDPRLPTHEGGTPILLIREQIFLDDVDSVVLYVRGLAECGLTIGGGGVIRGGVGRFEPVYRFSDSTKGWEKLVFKPTDFLVLDSTKVHREIIKIFIGKVRHYPNGLVEMLIKFNERIGVFRIRVETSPLYIYLKREDEK